MNRHQAPFWRLALVLVTVAVLCHGVTWTARGASLQALSQHAARVSVRGMTLVVSPASIPPGTSSQLTIRVKDSAGRPIAGTAIALSGGGGSGTRTIGAQPLTWRVTPHGTLPVTITARHAGYAPVSGRIQVAAPPPPAQVSALRPSLGVIALGVSLTRPATLHEGLQVQWKAVAGPTQRGSLTFADGSVMDLDHNTTVIIKSSSRTLLQAGQIFLQVVSGGQSHDVEAGSATAASLGTRYTVSSHNGKTLVTVLSGRVTLRNARKLVSLGANQQSSVQGKTPPGMPKKVNAAGVVAWASGLPSAPDAGTTHLAYLLLDRGNVLATYSIEAQRVVRTVHLPAPGTQLVVGPERDNLYIATRLGILVMSLHDGQIHIVGSGINATDIAALPHHRLAIADADYNEIILFDVTGVVHTSIVRLGYAPTGISVSADGLTAAVAGAGEVSLVDVVNGRVVTTRDVPGLVARPAIAPDGSLAYATLTQTDSLVVLSLAAQSIVGAIPLAAQAVFSSARPATSGGSGSVVVGTDGRVYALDTAAQAIDVLDPQTSTIVARYPLPAQPLSLAVTQDGKLMIVTGQPTKILIIDPVDGTILSQVAVAGAAGPITMPPPVNAATAQHTQALALASTTLVVSSVPQVEDIQREPESLPNATPPPAATPTAIDTATSTDSPTPTGSPTVTTATIVTATATAAPGIMPRPVIPPANTPIASPTFTATGTATMTDTPTATATATATATLTTTRTDTATSTAAATSTATATPTRTNSPTSTPTKTCVAPSHTPTPSDTPTVTPAQAASDTPTFAPTATITATATPSETITRTATNTPAGTSTPPGTATRTPTVPPSATRTVCPPRKAAPPARGTPGSLPTTTATQTT